MKRKLETVHIILLTIKKRNCEEIGPREQYGTIAHNKSKYMLDENQSLRINFEPFVKTVQVLAQLNLL